MENPFKNIQFDARGYRYGERIEIIKETLYAAFDGLIERRKQSVQELSDYEQGGVFIGEREEGHVLWEQSQVIRLKIDLIDEALSDLRKPYVMALYHTWERAVIQWAGISNGFAKHEQMAEAMLKLGVSPHPRLEAVRDLNNALKHNSKSFGPKLLHSWPETLPPAFILPEGSPHIDRYHIITISEGQMDEILEALLTSGPQVYPKA